MAKVPLVSREELPEDKQHIYDSIAGTRGSVLNVFRVLLNSPDAAEAAGDLGAYLRYVRPPRYRTVLHSVSRPYPDVVAVSVRL